MIIDDVGVKHSRVSNTNSKIISLVPSFTELLIELGLEDQIVARTNFCIYPKNKVRKIPKVGGTKDFNVDLINSLRPTHIIVNVDENPKDRVDELKGNKVVLHPKSFTDNISLFERLGYIFNVDKKADILKNSFSKFYKKKITAKPRKVLYLIWKNPWMTVSSDTYISSVLNYFGYKTVKTNSSHRYPKVDDITKFKNVDIVFLSSEPFGFNDRHINELEKIFKHTGPKIRKIRGDIVSWYGSRALLAFDYFDKEFADL